MIEVRVNYWPDTPNLRELKFFVNGKLELSVFVDYLQMENMKQTLIKATEEMLGGNDE